MTEREPPKPSSAAPQDEFPMPGEHEPQEQAEFPHDGDSHGQPHTPIVVGMGASAGGLEVFSELLHDLPGSSGLAFVVIQHLAPNHQSALAKLLSNATTMQVVEVTDGMIVEPNHVYVIPPQKLLTIAKGILRLAPRSDSRALELPIDAFFQSLAKDAQNRAIGVVLSGTASDGTLGLLEIKEAGGITIVQSPETAKYDGMPKSAIAAGAAELVLSPAEIAEELIRITRELGASSPAAAGESGNVSQSKEQIQRLYSLLRRESGVDFSQYKPATIRRRLQRRMMLQRISTIEQYLRFLKESPTEVGKLYQDILIHVTRFFREPDSFTVLCQRVFPQILAARQGDSPIRIWVPGCSTGEEVYSIAICMLEYLHETGSTANLQIFGTDVSGEAVERARNGLYSANALRDVSPTRLREHFTKTDGSFRINKTIRDVCVFARQDLSRDPPFSKLDLIVCRNVLIYFGQPLQKRLMSVFHYALKPTGFIMLGAAETVGLQGDLFGVVDKKHRIYSKRATAFHPNLEFAPHAASANRAGDARKPPGVFSGNTDVASEAHKILLARYAPPGVIVDDELQIVQFRGKTGPYLEPAPGEASLNLLKMLREGLLYGVQTAILEARGSEMPVRREGITIRSGGTELPINLEVIPVISSIKGRHFLVMFEDAARAVGQSDSSSPTETRSEAKLQDVGQEVAVLQQELAANREYLQSIIQDLEAANEELQSANEEILSSNEELQSTNEELDTAKEELQSTNEELNTVNDELHGRNEELSFVNSDLVNLLGSVQIAIVMVSRDLRIRRFTPMAERVLNLIEGDIGRPIGHIKPNIDCPDLEKLIGEVMDSVTIHERDVQDRQGNWYLLRIRPYKSIDHRINGAVLTLFDVTTARKQEAALREERDLNEAIFNTIRESLLVLDNNLRIRRINRYFAQVFKVTPSETEGRLIYELGSGQWNIPKLRSLLDDILAHNSVFDDFEVEHDFPKLGPRKMTLNARKVGRHSGEEPLILLAVKDSVP